MNLGGIIMRSWVKYILLSAVIIIFFGGGPLYIYLYALFFTILFAQLWAQIALFRITINRKVPDKGYFIGETIPICLEVKNIGRLPALWIYIEDRLPLGLSGKEIKEVFSLGGMKKQVLSFSVRACERGLYHFSPLKIMSGDILGLFHYRKECISQEEVIVFPRYKKIVFTDIGFMGLNALTKANMSFVTDPLVVIGSRDYQKGDPLKHIDWKATARTQSLKTRQIEYRKSLACAILLNGNLNDYISQDDFEKAIEIAASLSKWLLDRNDEVALYSNGRNKLYLEDRSLPVLGTSINDDKNQFIRILNSLALLHVGHSYPLYKLLDRIQSELSLGTALIFITPAVDNELWRRIVIEKKKGREIWVVLTKRLMQKEKEMYKQKGNSLKIKVFYAVENEEVGVIEFQLL